MILFFFYPECGLPSTGREPEDYAVGYVKSKFPIFVKDERINLVQGELIGFLMVTDFTKLTILEAHDKVYQYVQEVL